MVKLASVARARPDRLDFRCTSGSIAYGDHPRTSISAGLETPDDDCRGWKVRQTGPMFPCIFLAASAFLSRDSQTGEAK